MLAETVRFFIAVILVVSVPIFVWKIAEKFDQWRAVRRQKTSDAS
jgi:hypothetical protein